MKKVLIPTKLDLICKQMLEQSGLFTVVQQEAKDVAALASDHPEAYAIVVRSEKMGAAVIDAFPSLKVIIRAGAGYDNIDVKHARKRNIDVMNTPGANSNGVAEEVVAMMLTDARKILEADASCRKGDWEKTKFMGREITGKTIGIVGLGHIGRLVAKRLGGFEMRVLGYDPVLSPEKAAEVGVELVGLDELFAQSDYVSLHIPATDETRGIVNRRLLSLMKDGATLVNCARCEVINEADLREIKPIKKLRFLNDVYPKDEPGEKSVRDIADIMLPHLGANTFEANATAARYAARQLIDYDTKGISSAVVNRDVPVGLDPAYSSLAHTLALIARAVAGGGSLKAVNTSVYGGLKPFSEWLLVPVVAALHKDFERTMDAQAAQRYLDSMGVDHRVRETDESKKYGNAITVDLTVDTGAGTQRTHSVRGTVAEGHLMVSRIDGYDGLYFEPKGHVIGFTFEDRPGVLGQIAAALAGSGVNIDDVRNPHDSKGLTSIAVFKVNREVPADVMASICKAIGAIDHFAVNIA